MPATEKRVSEILLYVLEHGEEETCKLYNIKSDTIRRYRKRFPQLEVLYEQKELLKKLTDKFSPEELKAITKSSENGKIEKSTIKHLFDGEEIIFTHITDTHLGSIYTDPDLLLGIYEESEKQGSSFIAHSGDVVEGLSNRPGHVYELTHIGVDQQKEHAINMFKQYDKPIYMIDGNHDRWYIKQAGVKIVKDICKDLDNCFFLGHDEGDIELNGITIKMWHGEDSSSYAVSYRLQKICEAFQGGEKPHVLLAGHTHKAMYMFERNIHVVSGGSVQFQSKWMRGKRIAAHSGFWIIKMVVSNKEVKSFQPTFYPFYRKKIQAMKVR